MRLKTFSESINEIRIPKSETVISVIPHEEEISHMGEYDKEVEETISRNIEKYGIWGWCVVEVKYEYKGLSYSDFLGGCSYKSESDFRASSYFKEMVKTCEGEVGKLAIDIIRDLDKPKFGKE